MAFEFDTDRLGPDGDIDMPLFHVNREARQVALAWLKKQVSVVLSLSWSLLSVSMYAG